MTIRSKLKLGPIFSPLFANCYFALLRELLGDLDASRQERNFSILLRLLWFPWRAGFAPVRFRLSAASSPIIGISGSQATLPNVFPGSTNAQPESANGKKFVGAGERRVIRTPRVAQTSPESPGSHFSSKRHFLSDLAPSLWLFCERPQSPSPASPGWQCSVSDTRDMRNVRVSVKNRLFRAIFIGLWGARALLVSRQKKRYQKFSKKWRNFSQGIAIHLGRHVLVAGLMGHFS